MWSDPVGAGEKRRRDWLIGCPSLRARPISSSPFQREQLPTFGHSPQLVLAPIHEPHLRAADEIADRPRHDHLARTRRRGDARRDVDGEPREVAAALLAFTRVYAGPDVELGCARSVDDRTGA